MYLKVKFVNFSNVSGSIWEFVRIASSIGLMSFLASPDDRATEIAGLENDELRAVITLQTLR